VSAGEAPPAGRHRADDLDLASTADREQVVGAFTITDNRATVTTGTAATADPADDSIHAERVSLPLLTASRMERILSGDVASVGREIGAVLPSWWIEEREWLLRLRLKQVQEHPAAEPWLIRAIVPHAPEPVTAGLINFHGPPDELGFAEVGYELRPEFRGQGYAIAAVRAYFDWAAATHGVHRFRAGIAPGNTRSINLVTKLGMTKAGAQWDADDGLELLYTVEGWAPGREPA
jgi:RimJ/RimL family protein N-acetyltransferase